MNIIIEYNYNLLDITNNICSNVSLEYRIDEALNNGTFDFVSNDIDKNLPPFTKLIINDNGNKEYYFCSSESKLIIGDKNQRYLHSVTLIEPTKILETYIVGTKSFSIIKNKTISNGLDYNQNYTRMFILTELMANKYNVSFSFSDRVKQMTLEREYSFGSGTSLFDCLLEIMKSEHCIPQITSFSEDLSVDSYLIDCIDIEALKSNNITEIENYSSLNYLQSFDDYCNFVETEMSSVVDRDSIQKVLLTCSASGTNVISNDTACLETPSQIEDVGSISLVTEGFAGFTFFIGLSYAINYGSFGNENIQEIDLASFLSDRVLKNDNNHIYNTHVIDLISNYTDIIIDNYSSTTCLVQRCFLNNEFKGYLCTIKEVESLAYIDFSNNILEKTNFDLLSENDKPKYCYFTTGSNIIANLYSFGHDAFWDNIIYGEIKPFIWHVLNSYGNSPQIDFLEKANLYVNDIYYLDSYSCASAGNTSYSPRDYSFKVEYYTKSPFATKIEKSLKPSNEASFKNISKSYNNGANTIDFNLVLSGMQKATNLLGLMQTTLISRNDYKLGLKTDKGYIIKKQASFRIKNNGIINLEIEYNLCDNYNQIAEMIGVASQYEATNLPQNNIVNRFITCDLVMSNAFFEYLKDNNTNTMILLNINTNSTNHFKAVQVLNTSDNIYLVCESVDNYTFDYQKEKYDNDFSVKKPISISDSDNFIESCTFSIYELLSSSVNKDVLNSLPLVTNVNNFQMLKGSKALLLYKDPREKLIFCFNTKSDNDESSSLVSKLYIIVREGVASYKITRTHSYYGSIGTLYNNSTIYYGDELVISFEVKVGYDYANICPKTQYYNVGTHDLDVELYGIVKTIQLRVLADSRYIDLDINRYESTHASIGELGSYSVLYIGDGVNVTATPVANCFIINNGVYATSWNRRLSLNESNFNSFGRVIQYNINYYKCVVSDSIEILSFIYDSASETFGLRTKITNTLPFACNTRARIYVRTSNNTIFSKDVYLQAGESYEWYENDIRSTDLAVSSEFVGENLNNLIWTVQVVAPHRIRVNPSDGVASFTINRTYSDVVSAGYISNNEYVYKGDIITVSHVLKAGYSYSELSPKTRTFTVSNYDIEVELFTLLKSLMLIVGYDIDYVNLSVNRYESVHATTGEIGNYSSLYIGDSIEITATPVANCFIINNGVYATSWNRRLSLNESNFNSFTIGFVTYEINHYTCNVTDTIDILSFIYDKSSNTYGLRTKIVNRLPFSATIESRIYIKSTGTTLYSTSKYLTSGESYEWYENELRSEELAVSSTYIGENLLNLIDGMDVPLPHKIKVKTNAGVASYTINRIYSTAVETGVMANNDYIYYGDILMISYTCKAGYDYSNLSPSGQEYYVYNNDLEVYLNPIIQSITLTTTYDATQVELTAIKESSIYGDVGTITPPCQLYYGDKYNLYFKAKKGYYLYTAPSAYYGDITYSGSINESYFDEDSTRQLQFGVNSVKIITAYTVDNWIYKYDASSNSYSLLCKFKNNNPFAVNLECTIKTLGGVVLFSKTIRLEAQEESDDWYENEILATSVLLTATFIGDEQINGLCDELVITL